MKKEKKREEEFIHKKNSGCFHRFEGTGFLVFRDSQRPRPTEGDKPTHTMPHGPEGCRTLWARRNPTGFQRGDNSMCGIENQNGFRLLNTSTGWEGTVEPSLPNSAGRRFPPRAPGPARPSSQCEEGLDTFIHYSSCTPPREASEGCAASNEGVSHGRTRHINQGSGEQQKGEVKWNPQDARKGRPQKVSWWPVQGRQSRLGQVRGSRRG